LKQRDFLTCWGDDLGGPFQAVLMNPPFKQGLDIKHIFHAYEMLAPGGLLVGLCYDGARQGMTLRPLVDSWEQLPANTFKAEGTRAGVVLITWRKR
jgi:16S rRNA G1207 methylase RsmC